MAGQTLTWTLNTDRGTVSFGRLLPFSGGTYRVILNGAEPGVVYTFYLMDDSGLNCLAKSSYTPATGEYTLAFNSQALWDEFVREPHEARPFHCFVRNGALVGDKVVEDDTVAEGDLTVIWNPLWTDREVGEAYTMQGREGRPGAPGTPGRTGERGLSAYEVAQKNGFAGSEVDWLESLRGMGVAGLVQCDTDSLYYMVRCTRLDENGEIVLTLDQAPSEPNVVTAADCVTLATAQIVSGAKSFTQPISGNITGNAETAGSAVKANQDGSGRVISETYVTKAERELGLALNTPDARVVNLADAGALTLCGGEDPGEGASLTLNAGDSEEAGSFKLSAAASEVECQLKGDALGNLSWMGLSLLLPTGVVLPYAAGTPPPGFLPCDGSAVSRTEYKRLFDLVGTTYGEGDGETTFNLPNLTDRFVQGSATPGTEIAPGLPNLTGKVFIEALQADRTGVFRSGGGWTEYGGNNYHGVSDTILEFDASKSNPIYGASETVQPPALTLLFIIKY